MFVPSPKKVVAKAAAAALIMAPLTNAPVLPVNLGKRLSEAGRTKVLCAAPTPNPGARLPPIWMLSMPSSVRRFRRLVYALLLSEDESRDTAAGGDDPGDDERDLVFRKEPWLVTTRLYRRIRGRSRAV